jgi:hypothetical protein
VLGWPPLRHDPALVRVFRGSLLCRGFATTLNTWWIAVSLFAFIRVHSRFPFFENREYTRMDANKNRSWLFELGAFVAHALELVKKQKQKRLQPRIDTNGHE